MCSRANLRKGRMNDDAENANLGGSAGNRRALPPILFVHGMWHGGWCWEKFFVPFFRDGGFDARAMNLRKHGNGLKGSAPFTPVARLRSTETILFERPRNLNDRQS